MTEAILPPTPPFAWSRLRRSAHRRTDDAWLAQAWPRSRVLVVDRDTALVTDDGLVLVDPEKAPDGDRMFLGEDDEDTPYFAVLAPLPDLPGTRRVTIREIGHELNDLESALLVTAIALANWHRRHRYSPHDGQPTTMAEAGWARIGEGGRMVWPRTDPAVIVLVHDGVPGPGGRCLLGHNADPAQPVRVDEAEITSARWFTRTEIRDGLVGDREDFGLPMGSSIAHFLITEWVAGRA